MMQACNQHRGAEAVRWRIQGQSGLRNEFEVSLDNIVRPLLKHEINSLHLNLYKESFARAGIECKMNI